MIEVITTNPPYVVDGVSIARLEVHSVGFMAFAELGTRATHGAEGDAKKIARQMFRERIKRQVRAFNADGKRIEWEERFVLSMPTQYAIRIKEALTDVYDVVDAPPAKPEMISKGDGIETPIHIKLGTPIQLGGGKAPIAELEFQAKTLQDLEDAIVASTQIEQATAIMAIARPVGPDLTLTSLPSWALDAITLADGMWIMSTVVKTFFETPEK